MRAFPKVLTQLRVDNGWSQTDLAARTGLSRLKVHCLESGRTRADKEDLSALLAGFPPHDAVKLARAHIADEVPAQLIKMLSLGPSAPALRESAGLDLVNFTGRKKTPH